MPYEWFIAMRYLFARRKQTFISITSAITLLGVALGVWVMITVLSVMNGFEEQWRDKIIGANAHVIVTRVDGAMDSYEEVMAKMEKVPGVVAVAPFQLSQVMLRSESGVIGVELKGIDPARAPGVTNIRNDLVKGDLAWLSNPPPLESPGDGAGAEAPKRYPGIVLGEELAGLLDVRLKETLIVVSPFGGRLTPAGSSPRYRRYQVLPVRLTGSLRLP
ncbi:MAG: ABC transporter permease [Myxococcota bacterium]